MKKIVLSRKKQVALIFSLVFVATVGGFFVHKERSTFNPENSAQWDKQRIVRAAEAGDPTAVYMAGWLSYMGGYGFITDVQDAKKYWERAANEFHDSNAMMALVSIAENESNNSEVGKWLGEAARQDSAWAYLPYGLWWQKQTEAEQHLVVAQYWFAKAAAVGQVGGWYNLAMLVSADKTKEGAIKACNYLREAALFIAKNKEDAQSEAPVALFSLDTQQEKTLLREALKALECGKLERLTKK